MSTTNATGLAGARATIRAGGRLALLATLLAFPLATGRGNPGPAPG